MCSTLFVPIYDIDGRFLLPLATQDELKSCQVMSITVSADSCGGFILLAWDGPKTIISAFIQAFVRNRYNLSQFIAVVFGCTENIFFKQQWWENLDDAQQVKLGYFAFIDFLDLADRSRDHRQHMYNMIQEFRKPYVDWPIVSVLHCDAARESGSKQ